MHSCSLPCFLLSSFIWSILFHKYRKLYCILFAWVSFSSTFDYWNMISFFLTFRDILLTCKFMHINKDSTTLCTFDASFLQLRLLLRSFYSTRIIQFKSSFMRIGVCFIYIRISLISFSVFFFLSSAANKFDLFLIEFSVLQIKNKTVVIFHLRFSLAALGVLVDQLEHGAALDLFSD